MAKLPSRPSDAQLKAAEEAAKKKNNGKGGMSASDAARKKIKDAADARKPPKVIKPKAANSNAKPKPFNSGISAANKSNKTYGRAVPVNPPSTAVAKRIPGSEVAKPVNKPGTAVANRNPAGNIDELIKRMSGPGIKPRIPGALGAAINTLITLGSMVHSYGNKATAPNSAMSGAEPKKHKATASDSAMSGAEPKKRKALPSLPTPTTVKVAPIDKLKENAIKAPNKSVVTDRAPRAVYPAGKPNATQTKGNIDTRKDIITKTLDDAFGLSSRTMKQGEADRKSMRDEESRGR
jgi:hypothetical protein